MFHIPVLHLLQFNVTILSLCHPTVYDIITTNTMIWLHILFFMTQTNKKENEMIDLISIDSHVSYILRKRTFYYSLHDILYIFYIATMDTEEISRAFQSHHITILYFPSKVIHTKPSYIFAWQK